MSEIARFLVAPEASIREVIACIERNAKGIALVVDHEHRLIGTVTDGDIRRAIMARMDLDSAVRVLMERRDPLPYPGPLTALAGTPDNELLRLMNKYGLRHIPLLDEKKRVLGIALLSELTKDYESPLTAVVMAGGYGMRLRPLTDELPKPMLPIGERPLLELIIDQLRRAGIRRVNLTTHYKRELIVNHFGDGQDFGVEIHYLEEDRPLGTAGALGRLEISPEPLLVINGDILTRVDFRAMLDFHREHQADMTVAVRPYEFRVPYGVVEVSGVCIGGIKEKPLVQHLINAGIYLLSPRVCEYVPGDQAYDMPNLISRLIAEGRHVVSFPVHEYWLDVGHQDDYSQAQRDFGEGKVKR